MIDIIWFMFSFVGGETNEYLNPLRLYQTSLGTGGGTPRNSTAKSDKSSPVASEKIEVETSVEIDQLYVISTLLPIINMIILLT